MAKAVPRKATKIRSQLVMVEDDGFIEEYCSVDWTSPPIYDIYPNEEELLEKVNLSDTHHVLDKSPEDKAFDLSVAPINYVDFIGVDAILSNSSNQIYDMIYMAEKRQGGHDKLDIWQSDAWGIQDYHHRLPMIRDITCIVGHFCILILRNGQWNELIGHPKDHGKNRPNSRTNYVQPEENDVDRSVVQTHMLFHVFFRLSHVAVQTAICPVRTSAIALFYLNCLYFMFY
jgi:hypothetical protein